MHHQGKSHLETGKWRSTGHDIFLVLPQDLQRFFIGRACVPHTHATYSYPPPISTNHYYNDWSRNNRGLEGLITAHYATMQNTQVCDLFAADPS